MEEGLREPLTEREREVALLDGEGLSVSKIAARLDCAKRTIYQHIKNASRKIEGGSKPYVRVALWAQRVALKHDSESEFR